MDPPPPYLIDPHEARAFLEAKRWPQGTICPHCRAVGAAAKLNPNKHTKTHARPGAWQCNACRRQFTVTLGTVFEGSRLPLHKWLQAIHLLREAEPRITIQQLGAAIGATYKTAWSVARRIRRAGAHLRPSFDEAVMRLLTRQKPTVDRDLQAEMIRQLNAQNADQPFNR